MPSSSPAGCLRAGLSRVTGSSDAPFRQRRVVERDVLIAEKGRDAAARSLDFDAYQDRCREIESLRVELAELPRQRTGRRWLP